MKKVIFILMFFLLLFTVTAADYPKILIGANDLADVLTPEQEQSLTGMCEQIKRSTSVEIAVVTVKTTGGEGPVLYGARMGEKSGIGKRDKDNGVVILYSVEENERAISTGRGIESVLPDGKVGTIGRRSVKYFEEGNPYKGFTSILKDINVVLGGGKLKERFTIPTTDVEVEMTPTQMLVSIIGFIVLFIIVGLVIGFDNLFLLLWVFGSGGRSSGGSRRSGGGGRFGGGGAKF